MLTFYKDKLLLFQSLIEGNYVFWKQEENTKWLTLVFMIFCMEKHYSLHYLENLVFAFAIKDLQTYSNWRPIMLSLAAAKSYE